MENYEIDHYLDPILEHLLENVPDGKWKEVIGIASMWVDAERKNKKSVKG